MVVVDGEERRGEERWEGGCSKQTTRVWGHGSARLMPSLGAGTESAKPQTGGSEAGCVSRSGSGEGFVLRALGSHGRILNMGELSSESPVRAHSPLALICRFKTGPEVPPGGPALSVRASCTCWGACISQDEVRLS